jgi:hypothetical protein
LGEESLQRELKPGAAETVLKVNPKSLQSNPFLAQPRLRKATHGGGANSNEQRFLFRFEASQVPGKKGRRSIECCFAPKISENAELSPWENGG